MSHTRSIEFTYQTTIEHFATRARWFFYCDPIIQDRIRKGRATVAAIWAALITYGLSVLVLAGQFSQNIFYLVTGGLTLCVVITTWLLKGLLWRQPVSQRTERRLLKEWYKTNASNLPLGKVYITINENSINYTEIENDIDMRVPFSTVTAAHQVDDILFLSENNRYLGSVPLAPLREQDAIEQLRGWLVAAGVAGWPLGEEGPPPSPYRPK